ncbi:MAG: hypothetical protein SGJ05_09770 [bacterium]|nr:hypothetical protein [bacterium]
MKFPIAALALVALLITACSDDPVTPAADNFVVVTTGSNYVSTVDSVNNNPADTANPTYSPAGTDSTYVVTTSTIAGRKAVFLRGIHTFNGTTKIDTTYIAQDGNQLFSYYTLGVNDIADFPPIVAGYAWVRIGDNSASSWTALDTVIPNVTFMFGTTPFTANTSFKLNGSKVGTESITMNGTTHSANHFRVTGTAKLTTLLGDVYIYTLEDFWFVKDVGMVKYERGVTTGQGAILPTTLKVNGKRKTTTSFKVF